MSPPDVTLIAPYPPAGQLHGGHSGVASYTANLARALTGEGVAVEVVAPYLHDSCGDEPDSFHDGEVRVERRYPLGPTALPTAEAVVRERGAGVVHLQWELFLYGGPAAIVGLFPAMLRLRRSSRPLVTTVHQVLDPATIDRRTTSLHRVSAPPVLARAGIGTVQRAIERAADVTIVHEHAFRRVIPGATVIPHGIDCATPLDRQLARRRLGLDDRLVVLCFGYLAPYKGLEVVAEAARRVGPGVSVVIAGGEHPRMVGPGSYATWLRDRYGDAVDFRGWVPDDDVSAWFSAADLTLFPYPQPFSASGALALALGHGTPVLLSPALARCVGAPSPLVAPMRPDELAGRLDALAARPNDLATLRAATAGMADDRRWPTVARRHAEVYADVDAGVCADVREEVRDGSSPAARTLRAG